MNNAGFYLQRSSGGSTFENIGRIAGNGTSTTVHYYSFEDHNVTPNTIYYYRLMQMDFNNEFKYSNTLSGELKTSDFNISNIIPNPTTINPQTTVFVPENGNMVVNIYDILGQNIRSHSVALNKGNNKVDINLTDLSSATYMIKFNYNNNIITKKIIKN